MFILVLDIVQNGYSLISVLFQFVFLWGDFLSLLIPEMEQEIRGNVSKVRLAMEYSSSSFFFLTDSPIHTKARWIKDHIPWVKVHISFVVVCQPCRCLFICVLSTTGFSIYFYTTLTLALRNFLV